MQKILAITTLHFYLIASAIFMVYLALQTPRLFKVGFWFAVAAFAGHSTLILMRHTTPQGAVIYDIRDMFSFFAWALVAAFLSLKTRFDVRAVGAVVFPLAAGFFLLSLLSGGGAPTALVHAEHGSLWISTHVLFMVLGDAAFALAAAAGGLYFYQDWRLKNHRLRHPGRFLPSLEVLDKLNFGCVAAGFPLLTAGLVMGIVRTFGQNGFRLFAQPAVFLSLLAWLLYSGFIIARHTSGVRGRTAAAISLTGFALVLLTVVGASAFIPPGGPLPGP